MRRRHNFHRLDPVRYSWSRLRMDQFPTSDRSSDYGRPSSGSGLRATGQSYSCCCYPGPLIVMGNPEYRKAEAEIFHPPNAALTNEFAPPP